MRSALRIAAIACAILIVSIVFQSDEIQANKPNTGANEPDLALGGSATASSSASSTIPGHAIDGDTGTSWQCGTTTGCWLAVAFPLRSSVNEIHAHFLTTKYASPSLYLDTSGNGGYETGEKVWSTTKNNVLDVVRSDLATSYATGMKITIDAKVGTSKPVIAEFEAYLRYDSDRDGLTNQQETGTVHDPVERKGFLESVWNAIGSGNFFNLVLSLVIALQIVAAIAVNVILPGSGSIVAKVVETTVMGFLVGFFFTGLMMLLLQGLDATFKAVVPRGDSFWAEGAGLDVVGLITDLTSFMLGWEKAKGPGISVFKMLKKLDATWLTMSLAGLTITLVSVNWHGWPAVAASAVGLGFAFIGALFTLDKDPIDETPFAMAPLKYSEEAIALVALGYVMADFAKSLGEEL